MTPVPKRMREVACGNIGQKHQGWQTAFIAIEMMLRHPGSVETECLGVNNLLGHKPVTGGRVRLIKHSAEEAELFGISVRVMLFSLH